MNRPPALDGDITDDAARERLIFIHFPYTFTPNEEKIAAQPKKYRRIDTSLKLQKEAYRCALFKYLFDSSLGVTTFDVEEGAEMPAPSMEIYQDEATKALTKRFLQDADPLDNFLMTNYERDERDNTLHISIRDFTADFLKSDELRGCDDRAKYNTTSVFDMLQHNSNVAEDDLFRPQNGMRRTIGGGIRIQCKALLHWKKRATDDGSSSDESEQPSAPVLKRCRGMTVQNKRCKITSDSVQSTNPDIASAAKRLCTGSLCCGIHAAKEAAAAEEGEEGEAGEAASGSAVGVPRW